MKKNKSRVNTLSNTNVRELYVKSTNWPRLFCHLTLHFHQNVSVPVGHLSENIWKKKRQLQVENDHGGLSGHGEPHPPAGGPIISTMPQGCLIMAKFFIVIILGQYCNPDYSTWLLIYFGNITRLLHLKKRAFSNICFKLNSIERQINKCFKDCKT